MCEWPTNTHAALRKEIMSSGSRLSMTAVGTEMAGGVARGVDAIPMCSRTVRSAFFELAPVKRRAGQTYLALLNAIACVTVLTSWRVIAVQDDYGVICP